ncbi:MAG: ABC transporter ATP-binding protein [Anaerolineae bacterium]|nr:ABC transporter ATP-binding protein [Anaerolineae bacterium]
MTAILTLTNVSKSYHGRGALFGPAKALAAVKNVSLTLNSGEILAIVGESGAGKSTLARLILGLERPDQGQVVFSNVDLAQQSGRTLRKLRRQMHLIFQDPYQSLHPSMRVAELVAEPLRISRVNGLDRVERVKMALAEVGLTPVARFMDRFPHQLSGGQRQRVALARALIGQPKLIVADEPTSMLDVSLRAGILNIIGRLRSDYQIAFLYITHDLAVARNISDNIGVMFQGELVEMGPTETVIHHPQRTYTAKLLAASQGILPEGEFINGLNS